MARMSNRRKLAIATWRAPREGNIYGKLTLDATQALAYLEAKRTESGERVTMTTLVGKAIASALASEPTLNGRLRINRYVPYDSVDVAFLVQISQGADLAQVTVRGVDQKSVVEVASELRSRAERLRAGDDPEFKKSSRLVKVMPVWLMRRMLWLAGFLNTGLGIPAFGQKRFPFGSCVVTSVGMFGLDEGFAPPTPFLRVPVYVLVGAVRERPAAVDGKVVVRPEVTITATIDHRFIDGYQGGVLANAFRNVFDNPWSLDGLDGPPQTARRPRAAVARQGSAR